MYVLLRGREVSVGGLVCAAVELRILKGGLHLLYSNILPSYTPKHNRGEWNLICGDHSVKNYIFKST